MARMKVDSRINFNWCGNSRSFLQKTPKISLTLAFSNLNRDPYNCVEIWNALSEMPPIVTNTIHVSVLLTIYYYLGKYAEYPVTFSTCETSLTCRGISA